MKPNKIGQKVFVFFDGIETGKIITLHTNGYITLKMGITVAYLPKEYIFSSKGQCFLRNYKKILRQKIKDFVMFVHNKI